MFNKIIVLLLIISVTFEVATAKPIEEEDSFINKLNYKYENGTWTCYHVKCPVGTFGCRIRLFTIENNRKALYQSFECLDIEKKINIGAGDLIELSKPKIIDMDLEIYINDNSNNTTGFGVGGNGKAKVLVAVNELNGIKENVKKNDNVVVN